MICLAANFEEMRSDAVRRVQEMHRRSQNYVNMSNRPATERRQTAEPVPPKPPDPPPTAEQHTPPPHTAEHARTVNPTHNDSPRQNAYSTSNRNRSRNQRNGSGYNRNSGRGGRTNTTPPPPPPKPEPPEEKTSAKSEKTSDETSQKHGAFDFSKLLNGILSGKNIEEDRVILIIMLILLAKDGADTKLLIALGYLLL